MILPMSDSDTSPLALVRLDRQLTQSELAELSGLSQGWISKAESLAVDMPPERIQRLSEALTCTPELLTADPNDVRAGPIVHHRKRSSMPARSLASVQAKLQLAAVYGSRLLAMADSCMKIELRMEINFLFGPEEAANEMRERLEVGSGPAPDLVQLIENIGGVIAMCDLQTNKIDALSTWAPDGRPTFLINSRAPADRIRFTLVHELAHIGLHWKPSETAEEEADRFASEFLLPEQEIRPELEDITLERLAILKKHWKASMSSILRRARDLGQVTEYQYRSLLIDMGRSGYRTNEPVPLDPELPQRIASSIDGLLTRGLNWTEIEQLSLARRTELEDLFYVS